MWPIDREESIGKKGGGGGARNVPAPFCFTISQAQLGGGELFAEIMQIPLKGESIMMSPAGVRCKSVNRAPIRQRKGRGWRKGGKKRGKDKQRDDRQRSVMIDYTTSRAADWGKGEEKVRRFCRPKAHPLTADNSRLIRDGKRGDGEERNLDRSILC